MFSIHKQGVPSVTKVMSALSSHLSLYHLHYADTHTHTANNVCLLSLCVCVHVFQIRLKRILIKWVEQMWREIIFSVATLNKVYC